LVVLLTLSGTPAWTAPSIPDRAPNATDRQLIPRKPASKIYESRPLAQAGSQLSADPFRRAVQQAAVDAGRRRGQRVLPDVRLDDAMNDLAHALPEGEIPFGEAVEFVLNHYGIVEPYPKLLVENFPRTKENALRQAVSQELELPRGSALVTIGVGVDRGVSSTTVVIAFQDKGVDMEPVPRELPLGGRAQVAGTLLGQARQPRFYRTDPQGQTQALSATVTGAAFRTEIICARGEGAYRVEVCAKDERGPHVVARFPVYCGRVAPTTRPGLAGYRGGFEESVWDLKSADAEARMLELVNRERRAAGLAPVALDGALSNVARAYSEDQLIHGFADHVSPPTGGLEDRVRHAGLTVGRLLQTVVSGRPLEEMEADLMGNAKDRAAILDKDVSAAGIGVASSMTEFGGFRVVATQLFR
jgi:uncharacterized protein YkwD